jgi:hypothetical protein
MKHRNYVAILCGSLFLLLGTVVLAAAGVASSLPDILVDAKVRSEHFLPDFSFAGYANGNREIPDTGGTIVDVRTFGALPDDGKDDSKAVIAAISHANTVPGHQALVVPLCTSRGP